MSDSYEDIIDVIVAVQEGDFDIVCEAIRNKLVSVNCTDKDGCSLLHWAAINNRVEIANFLFDNGLNFTNGGGILFESPLQWAIRKKHYAMADIIFQKCHCDLSHKSKQGSDALHLACKLGDINATFLVLNWGANPNSVDGGGDTPLLWLLKNRSGQATLEIIRLLLKFGADVQFQNPNDGNTAMHLLAQTRGADYSLAFQIYQAGGGGVSSIENKNGLTPYTQAVNSENRLLARFLYDQLVFNFTPYWTPILFSAAVACLFFLLVSFLGFFYGLLYWGLAYMAISWVVLQWQVVDHRGRIDMGYTMGLFASLVVSFYVFVGDFMSLFMKLLCLAAVTGLVYVAYAFHSKKPLTSKADSRQAISALIVQSSPSEGPDAEADLRSLDNAGAPAVEKASPSSPKRSVFVKDQFTGALQRVSVDDLDKKTAGVSGKNPVRKRTIGPRLCGTCLADKRAIVQCAPSSSGAATKRGPAEAETVISMATHCNTCDMCVVDLDHHSTYLGNCVGKGNRRLYCLFLLMGGLCSFLYFIAAKWTHYHIYCAQYKGSVLSQVMGVEWCMLTSKPAFGLLSWISLYALAFFLLTLRMQVSMVARETTLINVMKRRYEMKPPTIKRANKNMMQFFLHGTYNVTYPKKGANPPASCCSKHGKCSDKTSGGEALKNTAEYDKALRMLSGIDSKLQAMEEGRTAPSTSHIPAADSRAPVTGSDRMNRSAAVSEVKTEPPRSAPQQPQGHSHGHGQNVSDDTDDDYDEEWADSAHNNYHRHYFNDEDEELDQGGEDQEQEDEFALDSTQEEAESAALLARNRVRTDSLQLFKENLNVKSNAAAMGNSKNGNFMRISSTERM